VATEHPGLLDLRRSGRRQSGRRAGSGRSPWWPWLLVGRDAGRREVLPDPLVGRSGNQDRDRVVQCAPGPANLLVVGHGEAGEPKWMQKARSGYSIPIPSAEVATGA
jgi:hypothetical protein